MKFSLIFTSAWLSFYLHSAAGISEGDKLETITTLDGKTFSSVTITKISKEGVRIVHSSGVTTVSVKQLPEDLLASLGLSVADAEVAEKEREQLEQLQKKKAEELQQRLELLSRSRIIDGRIIHVLSDEKAVLVDLNKEGFVISSPSDNKYRKEAITATPLNMNHIRRQDHLRLVPVTYKWVFHEDQDIVWIDVDSTKGLVDNKMIYGIFGESTNWKKDLWIVEEIGTTSYETVNGMQTVRRFKRRTEL